MVQLPTPIANSLRGRRDRYWGRQTARNHGCASNKGALGREAQGDPLEDLDRRIQINLARLFWILNTKTDAILQRETWTPARPHQARSWRSPGSGPCSRSPAPRPRAPRYQTITLFCKYVSFDQSCTLISGLSTVLRVVRGHPARRAPAGRNGLDGAAPMGSAPAGAN